MIHTSNYKPKVIPIFADLDPVEIDRVQELTAAISLNRDKIEEVGRVGILDWRKMAPGVGVTLRQLEYGSMDFWRKLANSSNAVNTIEFTDFKSSAVDIAGYKTDDDGTFLGTVYYPMLRLAGLGLAIGDPDALIERSFTLNGEDEKMLQGTNKFLCFKRSSISAGANQTVSLSAPTPVADPDNSGKYLFRVTRSRAGATTELTHGTQWSYDGAGNLTINGTSNSGDLIRVWYSAGSYMSNETVFLKNDVDVAGIQADCVSIFLETTNQVYRLQTVGIDSTFDRLDVREIGNKHVVARGIRDITNRVTLGRILEDYDVEEVLRGKAGTDYPIIDIRELSDELSLTIKIYEDNTKTNFKIGYKFRDLAPVGIDDGTPVNDYVSKGVTLEGESAFITNQSSLL